MKILMVSQYPTGPVFGGVEAVAQTLVSALCKREEIEELNVVTFKYGISPSDNEPQTLKKGSLYKIYSQDRFELITKMRGDVRRLKLLCDRFIPDIIHAQGLGKEGILSVQQNIPSVVTIHGLVNIERRLKIPTPTISQEIKLIMADRLLDLVINQADLIIATSAYDKGAYKRKKDRTLVSIPNPVPYEFFSMPSFDNGYIVLFVGVVQSRKNIAGIVRAFSKVIQKVPQAQLRIVGPTPSEDYMTRIKRLIFELGITEKVIWLGHITQEQVLAEYVKCALLVMFSEEETSPMAIAQATAAGKPVVASNIGGISDMVQDGENGYLVPKEDEDSLYERITELLLDKKLRLRMGKVAKKYSLERCHPDAIAEQTIRAYQLIK